MGASAAALYLVAAILAVANVVRAEAPSRPAERALPVSAALGALCLGGRPCPARPPPRDVPGLRGLRGRLLVRPVGDGLVPLRQSAPRPSRPGRLPLPVPSRAGPPRPVPDRRHGDHPRRSADVAPGSAVGTAFCGYGLFTIESVVAAAYLLQDRNLKRRNFGPVYRNLPALETLDRVMFELIGPAFLLFSVSIAMGVGLAHVNKWGVRWTTDPKVLATGFTWLVYGVLFHLRRGADRHGRRWPGSRCSASSASSWHSSAYTSWLTACITSASWSPEADG